MTIKTHKSRLKIILARLRQSPVAKNIGTAFAVQIVGYAVNFALNLLLARWLGAQQFGEFIFIKNWITILGIVGTLGLFGAATKFVSAYWVKLDIVSIHRFIVFSGTVTLVVATIFTIILFIFLGIFPPNNIQIASLLPVVPVIILMALHVLYSDILLALRYVFWGIAPVDLFRPVLMLSMLLCLIFVFGMTPLQAALISFAGSVAIVFVMQLVLTTWTLRLKARESFRSLTAIATKDYPVFAWLRFGLESLFFRGTIFVRLEIPAIVLGYWVGGVDVGLFVIAERAAYLTIFLSNAVRRVFEPMIAPYYEANDMGQLQIIHARITRWVFWVAIMGSTILFLFSDFLLGLFGAEFISARSILWILLIGQIVNAATGQVGSLLRFAGYEKLVRHISIISTVIMSICTILFTILFGASGTALGVSVGIGTQNIGFYIMAYHRLNICIPLRTYLPFGRLEQHHV